jgi:hypothetical protein
VADVISSPNERLLRSGTGVVASGVRRTFGPVEAVRGIDLTALPGEVTALVGPNGAGKTTLLLVLATLLVPDAGDVRVAGFDPVTEPEQVRARMGWAPDVFGLYDNLTGSEYLEFCGEAYRLSRAQARSRALELLELARLPEYADRRCTRCRAARSSGSGWPARWCTSRRCCCSTSRPAGWTRAAASSCASCSGCSPRGRRRRRQQPPARRPRGAGRPGRVRRPRRDRRRAPARPAAAGHRRAARGGCAPGLPALVAALERNGYDHDAPTPGRAWTCGCHRRGRRRAAARAGRRRRARSSPASRSAASSRRPTCS